MGQRSQSDQQELDAIVNSTGVLPPRHFVGVGLQIRAGDVMMDADLRSPQSRKEAFGVIRAGISVAVALLVVDPLEIEALVIKRIPGPGLVGMDGAPGTLSAWRASARRDARI